MQELAPGTVFAGHRIEGLAGRGGMGVVYRATHLALDRLVALKVIAPDLATDDGFRARFESESRIAASIDHPNVIPILHAGEDQGRLYITMRYVEGTDLRRLVSEQGALAPDRVAAIVQQVGAALDAAHARGLVHRDVKPANVLIAYRDGREHCYLTDFGLTKRVDADGGPTKTGQWVGTIDYVAPEQIQGVPLDARADVYALGCVLYHLLTGGIPYNRTTAVAKMFAHVNDPPPSLPSSFPAELDAVVGRAMAKLPSERYPSAGDLGRAVAAAVRGQEPVAIERSVAVGDAAPGATVAADVPATGEANTAALPASGSGWPEARGERPEARGAPPPPHYTPPASGNWPPASRPSPNARNRRPALLAAAIVALALIGGAAALAASGAFSGDDGGDEPTTSTQAGTSTETTEPTETTPPDGNITNEEVSSALAAYQKAYSTKDTDELGALLTDDVVRTSNRGPTLRGKEDVLAEYKRQFDATNSPSYTFETGQIRTGADEAEVDARYRIQLGGGAEDATGMLTLHMVPEYGGLLVDRIEAVADDSGSGTTMSIALPAGTCTRIAVDPGHDLRGNGATEPIGPGSKRRKIKDGGGTRGVATGTPEHRVNLEIALELRRQLKARGYCVTMTRTSSGGMSIGNVARARIANRSRAALFVRVHADGSTDRSRHGTSVLYPANTKGWTDDILPESKTAAQAIQGEMIKAMGSRDLGTVARSDMTGFNWADVPAVLAEVGFLTNASEDRRLGTAAYRRKVALGITRGIVKFAPSAPR